MFDGKTVESHLAEMVAAVGPFPPDFICRFEIPERIFTSDGTFVAPFRSTKTHWRFHIPFPLPVTDVEQPNLGFIKDQPRYEGFSLEGSLIGSSSRPEYESPLSEEERRDWLAFIRSMLKLDPRARKTARELLQHPWLQGEYTYPTYECDGYDHSKKAGGAQGILEVLIAMSCDFSAHTPL